LEWHGDVRHRSGLVHEYSILEIGWN
jgi:hypothetical protein